MAKKKPGRFFAIDRRIFENVLKLGSNETVSYLVQACGTGADHRTTSWSARSVFKYSGMSQSAAAKAIEHLGNRHFHTKSGERTRPRYKLSTYHEYKAGGETLNTDRQRTVYEIVCEGGQPCKKDRAIAKSLVKKNLLFADWSADLDCDVFSLPPQNPESEHLIWLPCELITGAAGERPPIARLRRHRDPMLIQLLIDFYDQVDIRDHGGVPKSIVWKCHNREPIWEVGNRTIWAFNRHSENITASHNDLTAKHFTDWHEGVGNFWERLDTLKQEGLVYWMPHLIEANHEEAEILHPLQPGKGNQPERKLNRAARVAAWSLMEEDETCSVEYLKDSRKSHFVVPVEKSFDDVQVVSILRPRYQAGTQMNFGRLGEYWSNCEDWIAVYDTLAGKLYEAPESEDEDDDYAEQSTNFSEQKAAVA